MKKKKFSLFSYLKANGTKLIIDTLLLVVMGMISVVSFKFFYSFSTNEGTFWSLFWGICGALIEIISVVLLKRSGLVNKLMAICLICMSLFVFAIESYQSAPDIAVEDTTYTDVIDNSTKILNDSAQALVNSINKTEGGYGTSNSKMATEVTKLVSTSLEVAKTGQEYKQSLSVNKQMEVFKLISAKTNVDARTLFIGFLFLRGALLELSMVVLAMKSKSVNKNKFDWKDYFISMLPKPKKQTKRGRPVGSKTKRKVNKSVIEKILEKKNNKAEPEVSPVEKNSVKPKRKLKPSAVQSIVSNITKNLESQQAVSDDIKPVENTIEEFSKEYEANEHKEDIPVATEGLSIPAMYESTLAPIVTPIVADNNITDNEVSNTVLTETAISDIPEQVIPEAVTPEAVVTEPMQALKQTPVKRILKRGVATEKVKEFFKATPEKKSAVDNEDQSFDDSKGSGIGI